MLHLFTIERFRKLVARLVGLRAGFGARCCCDLFVSQRLEPRRLLSSGFDVALIDKTLPSEAILERAMEPGGRVILYDGRTESAHQVLSRVVNWAEQSGCAIRSLSLLSHATAGRFELGNQWISKSSVDDIAVDLERLGKAMVDGGSINLYGCSLADPFGDGQILMDRVATLAKARVFASSNITGRGGDWVLEAASDDKIEAAPHINPFSTRVLAQWPFSLPGAGITVTPTSGLVTTESGGTATFTVVLATNPGGGNSVSIGLSSSDLTEGTVSPLVLTFSNSNWNAPQTVTVTGVDDSLLDGNTNYTIVTAPAISTSGSYNGINASNVSVTNIDNDAPGVSVTPVSGLITSEAGGSAAFGIFLNSQPTANVTIPITSSNTAEGTVSPGSLTFTTANWAVPQTVTVTGVDDAVDDGNIAYSIVTGAAASTDANYTGLNPLDVSVSNSDDDTAGITVTPTSGLITSEDGSAAGFTVMLASQPTANVSIGVFSSNTAEGTVAVSSLTFTAANWSTPQTVTVTGIDDLVDDGDVAYAIVTAAASSADPLYDARNAADVAVMNTDDDAAGITVAPISGSTTTEGGGTASFTMVLNSQPTADVTIGLWSSNLAEGTISASSITFSPADWNAAQTVVITGVDDEIDDGDIAYTIVTAAAASADLNYNGRDPSNVSVVNADNDTAGITIDPTAGLTTTEAGGTASFTIILTSQPSADVTLPISSSDSGEGTVSASSVTFTSADWNIARTVTVTGVNDFVADGNAAYMVLAGAATSADARYNGINPADVSLTNIDDDAAGIVVSPISGLMTTEAGGSAGFTIVLSSQPTANVTIAVASSNSSEGVCLVSSVNFTSADWNTPQTINVIGVDDFVNDGSVSYSVTTAGAVSSDLNYNGMDPADVALVNTDDDMAGITVTPTSGLTTTEAGGSSTFSLQLNSQPSADVIVSFASSNSNEGELSAPSITFTPANWNTAQMVTITGVDDNIDDGDILYSVITGCSSSDPLYNAIDPPDVSVTNTNDDLAGISVFPTSGLRTTEAGGTASFAVVLDSEPEADVSISITSGDLTEATVSVSSLTFTSLNWYLPQNVSVTGVDDVVRDGDVAYTIVTSAATSADASYNGLDPSDVVGSNSDDDVAEIIASPITGLATDEAGATATFSIVLTSQPTASVTIPLDSSDLTEGTLSVSSVSFDATDWSVPQILTVTGVDDLVQDGDIAYTILTSPAVSADPFYNGINAADVSIVNADDDVAGITVTPVSGLNTTEAGGTAAFSVVLDVQPSANVRISLSSSDPGEAAISASRLTFTPGNWNAPQIVTVTGVDDHIIDGDQSYSIILAPAVSADPYYDSVNPSDVTGSNSDDDVAGVVVTPVSGLVTRENGATASFTIVLTTQPAANVSIGLSSSNSAEGVVLSSSLTFTAANWDIAQSITVGGVNDLVDDGDISYDLIASVSASTDSDYAVLAATRIALTNTNDDTAGFTITSVPQSTTTESGGTASFDIVLNSQPRSNVFLALHSDDRTEGLPAVKNLTFTAANWNLPQKFTVRGVDDFIDDGDIPYRISVQPLSTNADLKYAALAAQDISLTNLDDDTAGLVIATPAHRLITTETGGEATIQVSLSTQPTSDVRVTIQSSDTSEATVENSPLRFTPANWNIPQTLTVRGAADAVVDGDVAYQIIIVPSGSADTAYQNIAPTTVDATNLDEDTAGISITTLSADDASASFSVRLTSRPRFPVVVVLSISGVIGTLSHAQLIFLPDEWSQPQSATLRFSDRAQFAGGTLLAVASSADSRYDQSQASKTFQRLAEVPVHAVLIQPHEVERIPFDFELPRAAIHPISFRPPKPARIVRWPVTFLNVPPPPAKTVADLKDPADLDDAPDDMPPPSIPAGPDPIPLDPQEPMPGPTCLIAQSEDRRVPALVASSRLHVGAVLRMMIPSLLALCHLTRSKRESNRARRVHKTRGELAAANPLEPGQYD